MTSGVEIWVPQRGGATEAALRKQSTSGPPRRALSRDSSGLRRPFALGVPLREELGLARGRRPGPQDGGIAELRRLLPLRLRGFLHLASDADAALDLGGIPRQRRRGRVGGRAERQAGPPRALVAPGVKAGGVAARRRPDRETVL